MPLTIKIIGANQLVKAEATGDSVTLVYTEAYAEGDVIHLLSDKEMYIVTQLEDSMAPAFGLLKSECVLTVPFGEKRVSYSPKSFTENVHLLWAREARKEEVQGYRNLALNPFDSHQNTGFYPHALANVETRGESVFAARNAINGNTASAGHGPWPFESWGINRQDDAEIRIDFGRDVMIDKLMITLRADFPHDNWWKTALIRFSDGSSFEPKFQKSGLPQAFPIERRTVSWLSMSNLKKDETDSSPFPALVQLECWGTSI